MKILKIVGISLGVVIGIFLLVAAFLPTEYTVSRSTEIAKPADSVYAVVSDFTTFTSWSPWAEMEPTAVVTLSGPLKEVGSKYAWVGTTTGQGSMTISALEPGKSITQDLAFLVPFESKSTVYWSFEPTATGTKTTWTIKGPNPYPVGRIMGLMMDGMMGKDFDRGLVKLKALVEAKQ
ncbi:MAG: SRPBCC family protein [Cytophagales bacterium]|nr:SRPBCC family protein [Cytophagales bacterium]